MKRDWGSVWLGLLLGGSSLLAFPVTASAAHRVGTYRGRTQPGKHVMTIGFDGGHVHGLDTVVFANCLGSGGGSEYHRTRSAKKIALAGSGQFSGTVPLFDGGKLKLRGKVSGSHAGGRGTVTYTRGVGNPFAGTYHLLACRGNFKWSAHWKHAGYPPAPKRPKPPKAPIKPGVTYRGKDDLGQPVSLHAAKDGIHIDHLLATYDFRCDDGTTGVFSSFNTKSFGTKVSVLGDFNWSATVATNVSPHTTFQFDGQFTSRTQVSGHVSVSFVSSTYGNCQGDQTWSATG